MHLAHLALTNFRTFRQLELDLQPGLHVLTSGNAFGKTNFLEGITLLATTRSFRAARDADMIAWKAIQDDPLPAASLSAKVETAGDPVTLDVAIIGSASQRVTTNGTALKASSRRFRVNGVARRASDLIGHLRVVVFGADDLDIIAGSPSGRRRYLDITISQFDPAYVRALRRYNRVLQQRNSLLRRLQERRATVDELDFWDGELASAGSVLLLGRTETLTALAEDAAAKHTELAPSGGRLEICYRPAIPAELAQKLNEPNLSQRLQVILSDGRAEDIRSGMTLMGPHRDDIAFLLEGHDAGTFASRGQQRTAALSLRLAEVLLSTKRTSDPPLLLLDDIFSELDAERRDHVMAIAHNVDQVIITSPDKDRPSPQDLPSARRYSIHDGLILPL